MNKRMKETITITITDTVILKNGGEKKRNIWVFSSKGGSNYTSL